MPGSLDEAAHCLLPFFSTQASKQKDSTRQARRWNKPSLVRIMEQNKIILLQGAITSKPSPHLQDSERHSHDDGVRCEGAAIGAANSDAGSAPLDAVHDASELYGMSSRQPLC